MLWKLLIFHVDTILSIGGSTICSGFKDNGSGGCGGSGNGVRSMKKWMEGGRKEIVENFSQFSKVENAFHHFGLLGKHFLKIQFRP